jgi:tetratricopeptide (TPR) repeat protein
MKRIILLFLTLSFPLLVFSQKSGIEYFKSGEEKLNNGEYSGAIEDFRNAMELKPEYAWACFKKIARAKDLEGDYIGSIYYYNRALEINPSDAEGFLERGREKSILDDLEGALSDFDKALELKQDFKEAYFERGFIKGLLGDKTGSCQDWAKASGLGYEKAAEYEGRFCAE